MKSLLHSFLGVFLLAIFVTGCSSSFSVRKHAGRQWVKTKREASSSTTTAQSYDFESHDGEVFEPDPGIDGSTEVSQERSAADERVTENRSRDIVSDPQPTTGKTSVKQHVNKKLKKSRVGINKDITHNSTTWLAYGITAFVLGILAGLLIVLAILTKFFLIFTIIGLALAIMAVIFGIMGLKGKKLRFFTIIGLALGGIAVIVFIVLIIMFATGSL